jgi:hypothetical protein
MQHLCPNFSAISGVSHGFFTRRGGVSTGIYDSLNCGYGSGDSLKNVRENRERVGELLGVDGAVLCTASQIHSAKAQIVQEPWQDSHAPTADALVTSETGIAIGVLTADCLPILFADAKNGVIAAAHSGWKGAISGIIENTILAMQQLGAKNDSIIATIGPAIAQSSYEVGAEFYANFLAQSSENERFFRHCEERSDVSIQKMQRDKDWIASATPRNDENKYLFNLPAYAKMQLEKAGISQINIIAKDTFSNDNEFFSYRRSCKRGETAYGRQISAIVML